ncbi:hypothetical protein [Endozoicomonas sp. YOMI1]|uniref:hypothetical protein n=1 Tax=Endozoicomonas sp. YOMI1 TaxID=2828739 RepID=UPI00214910CE|nr:hypothetical protein [Endozoicomonas sp. YOMI1]
MISGTKALPSSCFYNKAIPETVIAQVEAFKAQIADGTFTIFEGPIKAQDCSIKVYEGLLQLTKIYL